MATMEGVFAVCVTQMNSGTPLDACLAMHPAEAAELSPLECASLGSVGEWFNPAVLKTAEGVSLP